MMKKWLNSMKMLKYGYRFKVSCICAVLMALIGFAICILDKTMFHLGAFYIFLSTSSEYAADVMLSSLNSLGRCF